jgi:tRNA1Val (adenine37-N6)-methyltransferase
MMEMVVAGIEPKRLRMIHSRQGAPAKIVLLAGCKGGRPGLRVEKPLYLYETDGAERDYTEEVLQIYGEFPGGNK